MPDGGSIRIQFRADDSGVRAILTVDGEVQGTVASLSAYLLDGYEPDAHYQAWKDAVKAFVDRKLSDVTGLEVRSKYRRPRRGD